jgi:hypothetical protein
MRFKSLADYPQSAVQAAIDSLKEHEGLDLDYNRMSSIICEFILGLKDLGYTEIEISSTRHILGPDGYIDAP